MAREPKNQPADDEELMTVGELKDMLAEYENLLGEDDYHWVFEELLELKMRLLVLLESSTPSTEPMDIIDHIKHELTLYSLQLATGAQHRLKFRLLANHQTEKPN